MAKLEFKNLKCSVSVTCFSENDSIEDLEDIKNQIQDGLNDILSDVVADKNSVLKFEISEIVLDTNGVDIGK